MDWGTGGGSGPSANLCGFANCEISFGQGGVARCTVRSGPTHHHIAKVLGVLQHRQRIRPGPERHGLG